MRVSTKATLLSAAIILSACGGGKTPQKSFVNTTEWDDEVAKMMWDVTGEIAPYIELAPGFEYSIKEDEQDQYFYLISKADADLSEQYQKIVAGEGWELYGVDVSAGYNRYVYSTNNAVTETFIQFDYCPGGVSAKGFEIFMWNDVYQEAEIDYPLIKDWSDEVKAGFNEKFGETIPLAPLSKDYTYVWVEEDKNFIFTDKNGHSEALSRYYEDLRRDRDWTFSNSFWNQGYIVFEKKADHVENGVLHLNMRHSNKTGFIVDVWMTIEPPPVLITEWDAEIKDAFKRVFNDENAIPVAPISDEYIFDVGTQDEYTIIDILDPHPIEDFDQRFADILIADGFVENDYYYPRYGFHVFEKLSDQFPDFNICVNYMAVDDGVDIQLYLEEALGGSHFTDYFPVDQMKNWMSKYDIEYKEFPQFESLVDGMYLSESLGPDFTIQIYLNEDNNNLEEEYKDALAADGWVIDSSMHDLPGSSWGYFARKEGYDFYFRFFSILDEGEGALVFHVYPNSYDCTQGIKQ